MPEGVEHRMFICRRVAGPLLQLMRLGRIQRNNPQALPFQARRVNLTEVFSLSVSDLFTGVKSD